MKIIPTVGRVVLYWPTEHDNGNLDNDQPMAATVAMVHDENLVNLSVSGHDGNIFGKAGVTLIASDDEFGVATAGEAEWMAYQKDKAAITIPHNTPSSGSAVIEDSNE